MHWWAILLNIRYYKKLLDKAFVISGIIKVEKRVISQSRRLRFITLNHALRAQPTDYSLICQKHIQNEFLFDLCLYLCLCHVRTRCCSHKHKRKSAILFYIELAILRMSTCSARVVGLRSTILLTLVLKFIWSSENKAERAQITINLLEGDGPFPAPPITFSDHESTVDFVY